MLFSLTFSLAITATLAQAMDYKPCTFTCYNAEKCHINDPKSLQCRICGPRHGAEPQQCLAANATFGGPGLQPGKPVPTYYHDLSFTGLTVERTNELKPYALAPASQHQYARTDSINPAVLNFPSSPPNTTVDYTNTGVLAADFSFGCADPSTMTAKACVMSVVSRCANISMATGDASLTPDTQLFNYVPSSAQSASMAAASWEVPASSPGYMEVGFCANYTFNAVGLDKKPVFLYLDNIVVNHWYNIDV